MEDIVKLEILTQDEIDKLSEKTEAFLNRLGEHEDKKLIKSKERVAENGEVFTPRNIVKDMLDLDGIKEYSFLIDKTFLEPACGNGNFLIQIVARKLVAVPDDSETFDIDIVRCIASVYGVDIANDNINESRERMLSAVKMRYEESGHTLSADYEKSFKYILNRNIILGNTLTNERLPENEPVVPSDMNPKQKKIFIREERKLHDNRCKDNSNINLYFSEWKFNGTQVQRIEYGATDMDNPIHTYDFIDVDKLSEQVDDSQIEDNLI